MNAPTSDNLLIETALGAVRGAWAETRPERGEPRECSWRGEPRERSWRGEPRVCSWRGIPYAKPPTGALRWRAPQPAAPWLGVRDATRFGDDFPQPPLPPSRAPAQSEDCLTLNIWSPEGAAPGSLPVMLWFHGGGFVGGSGADARSDGTRLAARGVVVVSFNYRSGVFGFFAHPALAAESEHGSSGNYGLLDQLAALHWVRAHIAGFGGDAQRITAFGVSAGSASIALLLTMPAARGLFQRAVLHSPGCGRPLATRAQAEAAGAALSTEMSMAPGAALQSLRALSAAEVLALTARLNPAQRGLTTPRVLRPIHDGVWVPEDERSAWAAGRLQAMPLMVGTNADEGTLLTRNWPLATPADHAALVRANFPHAPDEACRVYPHVSEAFADTQFNFGARELLRTMAAQHADCWRYRFSRRRPGALDGPHHGDEVGYVFGQPEVGRAAQPVAVDALDLEMSQAMQAAWVAFAKGGSPQATGMPLWPRFGASFEPHDERHMEFGDALQLGEDPLRERLDFLRGYLARSAG